MIRKAKPSDVDALVKLAIEALEIDAYEELVISPGKVMALVKEAVSKPTDFVLVSEIEGVVVGCIGAIVSPMMMHERSQATVIMWYCKTGGDGMRLMDGFIEWAKTRPVIKQVQYCGERSGDQKIIAFLKRVYGFKSDAPFLYRNR